VLVGGAASDSGWSVRYLDTRALTHVGPIPTRARPRRYLLLTLRCPHLRRRASKRLDAPFRWYAGVHGHGGAR